MVFLDPTVEPIVVAVRTRHGFFFSSAATSDAIVSTLARLHPNGFPKDEEFVVVEGPGRFSSLRHASVIANILAFARSARLFRVRGPLHHPLTPEKLSRIVEKSLRVDVLKPFYGKPPSITRTKKKRKT